jgi:sugar lactone lactonase YvrE
MHAMLARILVLVLLLTGCRMPSLVPVTPGASGGVGTIVSSSTLSGRLGPAREVSADYREFAKGATVSLIDATTGYTSATTVTDANGNFVLRFPESFVPEPNRLYFLEAVKGIRERGPNTTPNDQYNQAGADALRLRTFIFYHSSAGWISPYNSQPGPIYISRETTALAIAIQLKQEIMATAKDFVGCLAADSTYVPVYGLTHAEYEQVRLGVFNSIDEDRDPLHFLAFDTNTGSFKNVYKGHFVSGLSPEQAAVGDEILITGDGFDRPGPVVVQFYNQITATVIGSPSKSAIRVKVPVGARNGAVTVSINGLRQLGPEFRVNSSDGHRALLDDVLYVANYDRRMIVRVMPDGSVDDFAQVADGPTQVVVYSDRSNPASPVDKLFVACNLADKVVAIDVATRAVTDFAAVTRPTGMAFLGDVLHVASATSGEVLRFKLDKSSAGAPLTGFTNPSALAFGYDFQSDSDLLYVAEQSNPDRVTQHNLSSGVKTPWTYRSAPKGLAVDSAGAVYVAAYDDDMVYRVLPTRALQAFARVPKPSALMLDENGVMYIASDSQHQIYRVSPLGDMKPYAYGINAPRGLAVDASGNLYVSLSESNAILKVEDLGAAGYRTKPFLAGIANPHSITWRNDRLYIAHQDVGVVTSSDSSGALRTEASDLTFPGGADVGSDGKLYVGKYGVSKSGEYLRGAPWSDYAASGGLQIVAPDGSMTARRPVLSQSDYGIVGLDDGTRFVIHRDYRKALIMYAPTSGADPSYRYRILKEFAASPKTIERNATGTVLFVTLDNDAKIYRFTTTGTPGPDSTYTMDTLSGLTSPSGMSYDKDGDFLYVIDGSSIKRIAGATGAASVDAGWGPVAATGASDVAFANNASHAAKLFVTFPSLLEVRAFPVAAPPAATLLTDAAYSYVAGLDINPQNIQVHPTNGQIYVRASNNSRSYTISPTKVVSFHLNYTGHSILRTMAITPDGSTVRADTTYPRVHGKAFLTGLVQSHEVAAHGDWIYVGSHMANEYTGLHAFNIADGSDMFIRGYEVTTSSSHPRYDYRGQTGPGVLAVNPMTNRLYAGTGHGQIYEAIIDGSASHGQNVLWTTLNLGERLYGMDITTTGDKLWVVGDSRNLYTARLSDKVVGTIWAGLSSPRF